MPKRKRNRYLKPRRLHDSLRMKEEELLKEKYGLKNKKEIWKAEASIKRTRNIAKKLIIKSEEEKKAFVEKLKKRGFKIDKISDALALNKEDWLKRRLQTILFLNGLANTISQSRQLVAHKHVSIGDSVVNIPSYQVSLQEEPLIKVNISLKIEKEGIEDIKEKLLEQLDQNG